MNSTIEADLLARRGPSVQINVDACVYRKLDSAIMVVKAAEDGRRYDVAPALDGSMDRRILVEGPMSPQLVIVGSILPQNPAQMGLAQDDNMVYTLAPDRSDQPFGKAVLPRRGWCNRLVSDAHGAQSTFNGSAVDAISITDEVVRSLIPGERLRYLPCDPFCCRICRDVDPDEVSTVQPNDDEAIEQVEAEGRGNEQVHGGDVQRMVAQE